MKAIFKTMAAVFLIVATTANSFAVQTLNHDTDELKPIDNKQVVPIFMEWYPPDFEIRYLDGKKQWVNNGFAHEIVDNIRVKMKMTPDNPKTEKRVPLEYPANLSFRVSKEAKVKAGYLKKPRLMYRVRVDTSYYTLSWKYYPREGLLVQNAKTGVVDAEKMEHFYRSVKSSLNADAKFAPQEAILGSIMFERAVSNKKDSLIGVTASGGILSAQVIPKKGKTLKKDWLNRFITGLEFFDTAQPIHYYESPTRAKYVNPMVERSLEEHIGEEEDLLGDLYEQFGKTAGWYDGVG